MKNFINSFTSFKNHYNNTQLYEFMTLKKTIGNN